MQKKYLSIAEASEFCGVSKRLLYQIVSNREIRSFRIHGKILLLLSDIEEFIQSKEIKAVDWNEKARELIKTGRGFIDSRSR